jgi:hypothetical protein
MHYLDFLAGLHERLRPRTYLEIGISQGHSLALSRCPSIGIDPQFCVTEGLQTPTVLVKATSDAYFARLERDRTGPFGKFPVDFAFIDGLHHFEQALRDFIGIERHAAATSVIAFDDVFPRDVEEAARFRDVMPWTGDVFRIPFALKRWRPDLTLIRVNTDPTGTLVVAHVDSTSPLLTDALDDIVRDYVEPDPQAVPAAVLRRHQALRPEKVLALPIWDELVAARQPIRGRAVPVVGPGGPNS